MDDVEKVAREICRMLGRDPDVLVPGNREQGGYGTMPDWHNERIHAIRAIAAHRVLSSEWSSSARPALSEAD